MTAVPASERGFRDSAMPKTLAITKAEHDAIVALRGRNFTDYEIGHFKRDQGEAPDIGDETTLGVPTKKGRAA